MVAVSSNNLQHTATVAVLYWVACLLLVTLEAAVGENVVSGVLFFVSIPAMVSGLLYANRSVLRCAERYMAMATLAVSVFVYASVILLLGLFAAARLKAYLVES